jgi:hypothetical protein
MRLARTTAPLPRKVWLAGLEPAVSGFQGRRGGQLPHSQMTNVVTCLESTATLVGDPGLLPRLLPLGTGVDPLPRGDQHVVAHRRASTLSGTRTRNLRDRARPPGVITASTTRACKAPAAGIEPAISRVTTARLPNSTTPDSDRRRQQDSNLRAVVAACALATRCLSSSAMPPESGRRGTRTPKARRPTRFRDGIPRRWQSFREVAPAGVEPAPSRLRAGSSAVC